jgi:hypothetical protein
VSAGQGSTPAETIVADLPLEAATAILPEAGSTEVGTTDGDRSDETAPVIREIPGR